MLFGSKVSDTRKNDVGRSENDIKRVLGEKTSFDVREAFNELRTNIVFSMTGKGTKRILVTSSFAAEGKSTTSLNMAISLAENNKNVLLVDCDLRRPNVGRLIGINEKRGLSNILVNDCEISDALCKTKFKNLDVVLTGSTPPNPTELLSSDGMKACLDSVSENYDYIILDTPPVNLVTDAVILSRLVNGVIIVCRQYVTEKKMLMSAVE
ncbi:MAG: CpsD/CapB family tyrosine-protein kinase, partial [Firmicutes bacterium]|nr:CpsD/CapB family tyrosine-protein kinase [Bacillota bacterium]